MFSTSPHQISPSFESTISENRLPEAIDNEYHPTRPPWPNGAIKLFDLGVYILGTDRGFKIIFSAIALALAVVLIKGQVEGSQPSSIVTYAAFCGAVRSRYDSFYSVLHEQSMSVQQTVS